MRDTKWQKHRLAVERWKENNREYYLEQKRRLASRPEYLAKRREMYRVRKNGDQQNISTNKLTDDAKRHEIIFGQLDCGQCTAPNT